MNRKPATKSGEGLESISEDSGSTRMDACQYRLRIDQWSDHPPFSHLHWWWTSRQLHWTPRQPTNPLFQVSHFALQHLSSLCWWAIHGQVSSTIRWQEVRPCLENCDRILGLNPSHSWSPYAATPTTTATMDLNWKAEIGVQFPTKDGNFGNRSLTESDLEQDLILSIPPPTGSDN